MDIRSPYVAGSFYPEEKQELLRYLRETLPVDLEKKPAKGILVPHAGYVYSGETAAKTYAQVELSETLLILGPNHTGKGKIFSLMSKGVWETPLGQVPIDEELSSFLLQGPGLEEDCEAHLGEHAIEVQLPFLQFLRPGFRFVPISVGTMRLDVIRAVGEFIGETLARHKERILIIASSDLNHYENDRVTREKDQRAIDAMLKLEEVKLAEAVEEHDISMCGFAPAYIMLVALQTLRAKQAELVEHTTSARVSQDYNRVVGYAGMIFR